MSKQFIVSFQTETTEHSVACSESEVEEQVEFHKKRGHVVSVIPAFFVRDEGC